MCAEEKRRRVKINQNYESLLEDKLDLWWRGTYYIFIEMGLFHTLKWIPHTCTHTRFHDDNGYPHTLLHKKIHTEKTTMTVSCHFQRECDIVFAHFFSGGITIKGSNVSTTTTTTTKKMIVLTHSFLFFMNGYLSWIIMTYRYHYFGRFDAHSEVEGNEIYYLREDDEACLNQEIFCLSTHVCTCIYIFLFESF